MANRQTKLAFLRRIIESLSKFQDNVYILDTGREREALQNYLNKTKMCAENLLHTENNHEDINKDVHYETGSDIL